MIKPKYFLLTLLALSLSMVSWSQNATANKQLIIRLDDIGMCHSSNEGAEMIFQSGLPVSASVMFAAPWWKEGVDILKRYPNVAVGVHLTLNAEWQNYKWGPILGKTVPTLVDSFGYFPARLTWFYNDIFALSEIENELRAQIERALASGLHIDYLDNHMGACTMTTEQRMLLEKLASDYGLGISGYFGEVNQSGVDSYKENNLNEWWQDIEKLPANELSLMVNHPGMDSPEMNALFVEGGDGTPIAPGRALVSKTFSTKDFLIRLKALNILPVTYRDIIKQIGVKQMTRPQKK
jgi:chitin disaccharide deacetylase